MKRCRICVGATSAPGRTTSWPSSRSPTRRVSAARCAALPTTEILARFANVPLFDRKQAEAGTPYWTEAYSDPAGAGWMVGYAAPVRADGRSVGVVGTAVPLDFVNSFVRAFDYPAGHLWLLNGQGQVLAASDGRNQEGARLLEMDDVLPEALRGSRSRASVGFTGHVHPCRRSVRVRAAGQLDAVDAPVRGVDQRAEPGRAAAPRAVGHHSCRPHPDPPARPPAPPAADRAAGVCRLPTTSTPKPGTCTRSRRLCPAGGSPSPALPPTPSRPSAARSTASRTARR